MDDHELEKALKDLSGEKTTVPEVLIRETKSALHSSRLLPIIVFVSFSFLTICALAAIYTFIHLEIPLQAKVYGITAMLAMFGAINLAIIAARGKIADFCRRMEIITCHQ